MKDKFRERFRNVIEKFQDRELGEKVLAIWAKCAERGGWSNFEEIEEIPFTLLTDTYGTSLIEHTVAVTMGALGLADAMKESYVEVPFDIKRDWVIAGGLLHDVGKLMEIEKTESGEYRKSYAGMCARHPISGAIAAAEAGLCQEIQNIIICHAKEGDGRPQRIEGVLIHQADFATFNPCVMKGKGLLIGE